MIRCILVLLILIGSLSGSWAEVSAQETETGDPRSMCVSIMQEVQDMVSYIANRIEANADKGREICDKSVEQLNRILQSLRRLRRAVSPLKRPTVDEVTRKVASARFLIIADCCSQKGMESLQSALDDLSVLQNGL